jgi:hypothetical protein
MGGCGYWLCFVILARPPLLRAATLPVSEPPITDGR